MAIATELAVQLRKAAPLQARARQILSVPASKSARQAWYTCIALITAIASTPAAFAFGFDDVAAIALRTAAKPYVPPAALRADLPKFDYDAFRDIRFRTENALWHREGLPFELQFFLAVREQPVAISEIAGGASAKLPFDGRDFDIGRNRIPPQVLKTLGLAGFRAHFNLNSFDYKDELVAFLGASYFRALGKDQRYGLSARGLAIDTVGGRGEEFPRFTAFWIERPRLDASALTVYALLDSPRASGAYQFLIRPGDATTMDVRTRLFLRAGSTISTLGLAPLTSMYLHGENQPSTTDFRPEVHDSDGLLISSGNEWLWRPLVNPSRAIATSFSTSALHGFGLMQRDRAFAHYEDDEARYDKRPSAWVEPLGDWGEGRVELLQLPTGDEYHDNVVAYWVPARMPAAGKALDFAYRISWQGNAQRHSPGAWVVQSRRGQGHAPLKGEEFQFVVDFTGPALDALPAGSNVEAVATAVANAQLLEQNAYRIAANGHWRMTIRGLRRDPAQAVELRAFLRSNDNTLSETWTYLIPPN